MSKRFIAYLSIPSYLGYYLAVRRSLLSILVMFLITFGLPSISNADSGNPPKLNSVEQLTNGTYRPGDVITFRVNYSGGNPGLGSISMRTECVEDIFSSYINWSRSYTSIRESFGWFQYIEPFDLTKINILSGVISNRCTNGLHRFWDAQIVDQTNLISNLDKEVEAPQGLTYTVAEAHLVQDGEIRPEPQNDEINLLNIPQKITLDSNSIKEFSLPRLSKNGQVLFWLSNGSCKVIVPFASDAGGKLRITSQGACGLKLKGLPQVHLFNLPEILSNSPFTKTSVGISDRTATYYVVDPKSEGFNVGNSEINDLINKFLDLAKKRPDLKNSVDKVVDELKKASSSSDLSGFVPLIASANKQYTALVKSKRKKYSINCTSGTSTKVVTALNPKCPKGFKKVS